MKFFVRISLAVVVYCGFSIYTPVLAQSSTNLVKTFDLLAYHFVADPARGVVYASLKNDKSVAVIDLATLTVSKMLTVGAAPHGMSMSPDGTKLYVALSGETSIGVIDLTTLTVLPKLTISVKPNLIEAGLDNRLYVVTGNSVFQIDGTTGATQAMLGVSFGWTFLRISPDRKTIYVGNATLSPSTLESFDVSTSTATLLQTSDFGATGADGEGLAISHDGKLLCYPNMYGNNTDGTTDVYDPSDFNVVYGSFAVETFPGVVAFGWDDLTAFVYHFQADTIYLFSTQSFLQLGSLSLQPKLPSRIVVDMIADPTGHYLLVADDEALRIFDLLANPTTSAIASVGVDFSYQAPIYVTPKTSSVTGLPPGLTFDKTTRTISGMATKDGVFPVVITASDGSHTVNVNLTLTVYPNSRALNISTRAQVETGDNVLIGGFIIQGSTYKDVAVRAIGPSLAVNGVPIPGRLNNPTLELHDATGAQIAFNDDWQTDYNSSILTYLHLAPTDPKEAALYTTLLPGAYTIVVRGKSNTTGIALAEIYDADSGQQPDPRLANISTRGRVETGDSVMIGGFIVSGPDSTSMLIRGIGPSLAGLGVAGSLGDPQLNLYDSQGTNVAFNDNWRDTQEAEIQASGLAPTDDHESAIDVLLTPGAYTAIVSGAGGTSGVALVESYNLP